MAGNRRLLFLSLALTYVPFMLWLRFVLDYPYGTFKALTSSTFAAIIGLASGAERLLDRRLCQAARAKALVDFLCDQPLADLGEEFSVEPARQPTDFRPAGGVLGHQPPYGRDLVLQIVENQRRIEKLHLQKPFSRPGEFI